MKHILRSILWMLFLLSTAVVVTLNFRPLYYHDMENLKIEETSGYSESEIRKNYTSLIKYNSLLYRGDLKLTLPMSDSGRIHFEEVKVVFDIVQIVFILSFIGVLVSIIFARRSKDYRFIRNGGILSIVIPTLLGIFMGINWDYAFTAFHKVLFRNNYWLFSEVSDPVIKILPDTFFLHCAILMVVLALIGAILSIIFYYRKAFVHK